MKNIYKTPKYNLNGKYSLGFTLMEVLIAMAIGLVILVGALSYFGTGVRTVTTSDAYARMHESASRAAGMISRDIQLGGFYGFGGSANVRNIMGEDGNLYSAGGKFNPPRGDAHFRSANQCGANYMLPLQTEDRAFPIEYYADKNEFAVALASSDPSADVNVCVPNMHPASPVIVVRGALEGIMINDNSVLQNPTGNGLSAKRLYASAAPTANLDTQSVIYFFGAGITETTPANYKPYSYAQAFADGLIQKKQSGEYFPIVQYTTRIYYIRDYFTAIGDNIPTLVRWTLTDGATEYTVGSTVERMVPGVERMNFIWGVDDRGDFEVNSEEDIGDGVTDFWTSSVSPNQFGNINSVRMQILVRSPGIDTQYNDSEITYNFDRANGTIVSYNCKGDTATYANACKHRRLLYEGTTSVRNCSLRRRGGILKTGGC